MKRHKDFWQVTEDSLDKAMKAYENRSFNEK
jgi:2-haloacid dehalogenase